MKGYLGIKMLPFILNHTHGTSIYCISDSDEKEVFMIPLTIGCFHDMYEFIDKNRFKGIAFRIIPLSINYDYLSDIYNIVTIFARQEVDIKWIYPTRPKKYFTEQFVLAQICDYTYINTYDEKLSVEYIKSGVEDLYDVFIRTEEKSLLFSLYMTEDKLNMFLRTGTFEIHMCGDPSRHGGISGSDLIGRKDKKNIILFNFTSYDSFVSLKTKFEIGNLL